jgi:hypothetical protein
MWKMRAIEFECDGKTVLVRPGEDGEPEFLDYDLDHDVTLAEMGYPASECLQLYRKWSINPYSFCVEMGLLPPAFDFTRPMLVVPRRNLPKMINRTVTRIGNASGPDANWYDHYFEGWVNGVVFEIPLEPGAREQLYEDAELDEYFPDIVDFAISNEIELINFMDPVAELLPGFPEFEQY